MDITITPGKLSGRICAVPSKSQAHRVLICAAFSNKEMALECAHTNQDIEATAACLNSIGADIKKTAYGYHIAPVSSIPESATIDCGESGSTLRFLLPVVCALGIHTTIHMSGRLPQRPLSPLWEELERMGCKLSRPTESTLEVSGKLRNGVFRISGNVSSQFISGLLLASALIPGESYVQIIGKLESKPYVDLTLQVLDLFGIGTDHFRIQGSRPFSGPKQFRIEGDWSNAAFFLAANQMGSRVRIDNLNFNSIQGDRAVAEILQMDTPCPTIDAADIPDLVPILAVYFAGKNGAVFTGVRRLRLKESDRIASVCEMLTTLGIACASGDDILQIGSGTFTGGIVNSYSDHRIAMAAGIAATAATGPVTILGADCVTKSYPAFWQEYARLGGKYE